MSGQWLYRVVPARSGMVGDPTPEEAALVGAHFEYLVRLRDRGILILAGRTQEEQGTFGIVIFEAETEDEARRITEADPAIAGGVFEVSLHPYRVAVARDGLV